MTYQASISKESIAGLPTAAFDGKIIVVHSVEELEYAIAYLSEHKLIGFDTETKPSFSRGQSHKVALLQLSTDEICFLIRLNEIGFPQVLVELLNNIDVKKVGLSLRDDFKALSKRAHIYPDSFVDLQNVVHEYGIKDQSLQKIYAILFGKRISKSQRLSNWEASELTPAQQLYAATDAWACHQIYQKLKQDV
ncbi:3'-5' exonuclease [Paludibacter sp.]|uniref:3'-5' exonuclease n=1 Tax=Paludibacter sp. TaxID=1898105 RepID=UPI0013531869|nr:3'-5' exonuclease [Paludibacter sp.]MTK53953.1 3'-5' exonuclease domain-containing protein 2 [Paludibacter sp.]